MLVLTMLKATGTSGVVEMTEVQCMLNEGQVLVKGLVVSVTSLTEVFVLIPNIGHKLTTKFYYRVQAAP